MFSREITKYTVIYGVNIRFWPTLCIYLVVVHTIQPRDHCTLIFFSQTDSGQRYSHTHRLSAQFVSICR